MPFSSSAKIAYGNSVTLESSVAGGTAPYTYQWLYSIDGTKWYVAQGTSSKFTFSPYNAPSVQYVMLTVYDKYGSSANSNVCTITVTGSSTGVSVSIPAGYTVVAGQTLDLTALASGGSGTYKYQWQYSTDGTNWTNLGSGLATYTYRTVASPNKQYLRVVVTDSTGKEATSNVCTINVTPGSLTDTLRVVSQPAIPTLSLGDSFTLTVTVDGTAPYTYQWQRAYGNGTWSNVGSRQTTASVTSSISGTVSATDAAYGVYYKCVISDATGAAVETVPVSLNIKNTTPSTDALSIAFSQTNYEITEGASLTLQPIVTGNPITFSWYIDGSSYASSYANTYVIGNMKAGTQHEVTCEVKDAKGNVAKATCYVYVSADMYVDLFPASNVTVGVPQTFEIQTIYGTTGQLTISWYLDGNLVATNAGRTWTHTFGPNDVGNHTVTVVVKDESARAAATDSTTFTVQRASGSNAGK